MSNIIGVSNTKQTRGLSKTLGGNTVVAISLWGLAIFAFNVMAICGGQDRWTTSEWAGWNAGQPRRTPSAAEVDGHNQPRFPFYFHEDAFHAGKRSAFDQHRLAHLHIGIRSDRQPGLDHSSNPFDLGVRDALRQFAKSNHVYNPGRREDRKGGRLD